MKSQIERRDYALTDVVIEERDDTGPVIRGHAAVFNQLSEDLGGFREKIAPGAFADAVKEDDVRALFNHDSNLILGRSTAGTLRMSEDKKGLAIEIDPPDTQAGRDLMVSMRRGDVSQMSFGFKVEAQEWDESGETIVRTVNRARLFDVSAVVFPAYPQTDVAVREFRSWQDSKKPDNWRENLRNRELDLIEI